MPLDSMAHPIHIYLTKHCSSQPVPPTKYSDHGGWMQHALGEAECEGLSNLGFRVGGHDS